MTPNWELIGYFLNQRLQSDKDKKQLMLKETILFDYNKDMNE